MRTGLQLKSIISITLLILIVAITLSAYFLSIQKKLVFHDLSKRGVSLTQNLAYNSAYGLLIASQHALLPLLKGLLNEEDIVYAIIQDYRGGILASVGEGETIDAALSGTINDTALTSRQPVVQQYSSRGGEPLYDVTVPILFTEEPLIDRGLDFLRYRRGYGKNQMLGVARIGMSLKSTYVHLRSIQIRIAWLTLGIIVLSILITVGIVRTIVNPIRMLLEGTKKIAQGDLSFRVPLKTRDELGLLASSFNQMAVDLEKSRREIEDYSRTLEERVRQRTDELTEAHRKLQSAYDELQRLDNAKDHFISLVSHELKTPLSSISSYTQAIIDGTSETKKDKEADLKVIQSETERLTRLINNILDLSKMEAGKMQFHLEKVNLATLIESCVTSISPFFQEKKLTLKNTFKKTTPCVKADYDRITQVVTNILSNAIKFTHQGGTITISGGKKDSFVETAVSDTGIGISEKNLPLVFDKFHQLEDVELHTAGTGLGLPISKEIIELHGGTIRVESVLHKESTFFFTLPVYQ